MMPSNLKSVLLSILASLFLMACSNPEKLIEKGDFDQAITLSAKKLSGKKNKKEKFVKATEEAFRKATNLDMRRIKSLESEGRAENWVEINRIYTKIKKRQDLIEPLLPLVDEDGYKAEFMFVKVEGPLYESKEKAAQFYYIEGKRLLAQGELGDKEAARQAYNHFEDIRQYFKTYKDEDKLMKKAHELGTVYVLFSVENNSFSILPLGFEREIKKVGVREMESFWKKVHDTPERNQTYDYNVVMNLRQIDVSPERVQEREYFDRKNIEDGWRYVLDQNGNVLKDSLGRDVKEPNNIEVTARVIEVLQTKSAIVSGKLEFFDNKTKQLIHSENIAAEAIFENYASKFDGDRRALSDESKRKIGNAPLPFPSDGDLVMQAADHLKPVIQDKIKKGLRM